MRTTSSRVLLACQPIVGRDHAVVAYELLYRSACKREGPSSSTTRLPCRYSKAFEPLLEFDDVVKIDPVQLDARSLARLVQQLRAWPARLLAEKVDTAVELKQCFDLGVDCSGASSAEDRWR